MSKNVSYSLEQFETLSIEKFRKDLSDSHVESHNSEVALQSRTWDKEFNDLKAILRGKKGRVLFEYSIPSLMKVIDVVLLYHGKIYILEYKGNSEAYNTADQEQASGYAYRLKFFHSNSNDNWIVPILVATDAYDHELSVKKSEEDMVTECICCNSENLKEAIELVDEALPYDGGDDWETVWENGIYKASPTIIDAARNVWRRNNVAGFSLGESTEETRLKAEDYIVNTVVPETISRPSGQRKSIVFVTGVPGAGKTLVGLNVSVRLQEKGASMLSGNGPLVAVLTAALKQDLKRNKKNLLRPKDEISVESIIRDAYGYKEEIFEKRLQYTPGEGTVSLKEGADMGSQHVIIFDEAQRAWNQNKLIRPGQTGRKYWQEEKFPFSEAGLLLWDMNQRDWGVFVCLVGGGQEINTGEAGIGEWLKAIKSNPELSGWHIYMSDAMKGPEYNRKDSDAETLESYREYFKLEGKLTIDPSLHLTACQRSCRSDQVANFVQALLECDTDTARQCYNNFKDKYQIYITRDVEKAKMQLRKRQKELSPLSEVRIGMLMSSKAARLRPLGFEIKKVTEYRDKVSNWFLDPSDYINSSDFLEVALNEFFVQGLELELDAVMWDADFRYDPKNNVWCYYDFNGHYWSSVDKEEQDTKRFYMKNAYRVLLTRARYGMIIVVPKGCEYDAEGNPVDKTRLPEYYDCTYNYLRSIGLKEM